MTLAIATLGTTLAATAPAFAASPVAPSISSRPTLIEPAGGAGYRFFDSATLSGTSPSAPAPTGAVTFRVFGPTLWPFNYGSDSCAVLPAYESTNMLANGSATSDTFVPPPGAEKLYLFTVSYGGDSDYAPVAGACGAANESLLVPLVAFADVGVAPGDGESGSSAPTIPAPVPSLSGFGVSPAVFARRGSASSRRPRITFVLSRASKVTITFAKKVPGVRVAAGCVAVDNRSQRGRRLAPCTATRVLGAMLRAGHAGANEFVFNDRVASRPLGPGSYVARAAPVGNSNTLSSSFRVSA